MMDAELDRLFKKAEDHYPHYATTPFGQKLDPREIQASKKYGEFMRLPLYSRKLNRWCFENDAMRDSFVHDHQDQGAQREDIS
jgi:hypothetical protein